MGLCILLRVSAAPEKVCISGRTAGPSSGGHQGAFLPDHTTNRLVLLKVSRLGNSQPPARVPKFSHHFRQLGARVLDHTLGGAGGPPGPLPLGELSSAPAPGVPSRDTPSRDTPGWPHPRRYPARCSSPVPSALDPVPCSDSAHSPRWGGLRSGRTDRRSSKPVSLAAAAAQPGRTVAGDTWRSGSNRARSLPAPPRPAPPRMLLFWSLGVTGCRGRAWGRVPALRGNLLPPTWVGSDLSPDASRGKGTWQRSRHHPELGVKLKSRSGHFFPHSCHSPKLC